MISWWTHTVEWPCYISKINVPVPVGKCFCVSYPHILNFILCLYFVGEAMTKCNFCSMLLSLVLGTNIHVCTYAHTSLSHAMLSLMLHLESGFDGLRFGCKLESNKVWYVPLGYSQVYDIQVYNTSQMYQKKIRVFNEIINNSGKHYDATEQKQVF